MAFNGRFGGVATDIYVPIAAVVGIYARENGQGMVLSRRTPPGRRTSRRRTRSSPRGVLLKIVK